ncbi:kinase-like protein [Cubamyces sp. BRFM 1775]|nr:kinase-like protein [Cubamyces sp. BRFM 1775]
MTTSTRPLSRIAEQPEQSATKRKLPSLLRRLASQTRLGRSNKAVSGSPLALAPSPRRSTESVAAVQTSSALQNDTSAPLSSDAVLECERSPSGSSPSDSGSIPSSLPEVPSVIVTECSSLASLSSAAPESLISIDSRHAKHCYRAADFTFQCTLGVGRFGRVHLACSEYNSRFYAIKVINKEKVVMAKEESRVCSEQDALQAVRHPFIVNLWGTFQDTANLYMVMEFVRGGELSTLLQRANRFPDTVAKFYAAEVALVLNYLHNKGIAHRDINLSNILLSHDGHIRVIDFGLTKTGIPETPKVSGNPNYQAPETIACECYSTSVDWYALGVLIFEMLSGSPPFHKADISPTVLYARIAQGPFSIKWPALHPSAKDLILKLMVREPSRRLGNHEHGKGDVFLHPWFAEVVWEKLLNREIPAPYLPQLADEGDTSAFQEVPEDDAAVAQYGKIVPDPYGERFPRFQYSDV